MWAGVEIMLLLGLSVVYMTVRGRKPAPTARSPTTVTFARPGSPASLPGSSIRERGSRASHSLGPHHHAAVRDELRRTSPLGSFAEDAGAMIGSKGAVWGTEGREYRSVNFSASTMTQDERGKVADITRVVIAQMTEHCMHSSSPRLSLRACSMRL